MAKKPEVAVDPKTTDTNVTPTPAPAPDIKQPDAPAPDGEKIPQSDPVPVSRETLVSAFTESKKNLDEATAAGNFADIGKLSKKMQDAINAVNLFDSKLATEKAAKDAEIKRLASFDYVAEKFGIDRAKIETLVEADKTDTNTPLRIALTAIFGGKVTQAKEGQTGTSLTGNKTAGERGGKSKEILEFLQTGTATRAQMLERYPTDGNADKLNGTARTVISNGGWKINADGVYTQG